MSNQNNNLSQLVNQDFNSSHNSHQFEQQTEQYVTRNEFWEFKNNIFLIYYIFIFKFIYVIR